MIEEVMAYEAYLECVNADQFAQEIDQRTGTFKSAEAAIAATRSRAFAEVSQILKDATK